MNRLINNEIHNSNFLHVIIFSKADADASNFSQEQYSVYV